MLKKGQSGMQIIITWKKTCMARASKEGLMYATTLQNKLIQA